MQPVEENKPQRLKITVGGSSQLNRPTSSSSSSQQLSHHANASIQRSGSAVPFTSVNANVKLFDLCSTKSSRPRGHRGGGRKKTDNETAAASAASESTPAAAAATGGRTGSTNKANAPKPSNVATEPPPKKQKSTGPRVEFVNGKMVIKESSLELAQDGMDDDYVYEEVLEEGGQSSVTYNSFTNRPKSFRWGLQETWLFYQAVRQCGTNFSLMQTFFPGRTRDALKKKFFREEKEHPELIKHALTAGIPLDMGLFSTFFGDNTLMHPEGEQQQPAVGLVASQSTIPLQTAIAAVPTTTSLHEAPLLAADANVILV